MDKKNIYEEIARVAHDLYEKRGRAHGYDLHDWLDAEKIVLKRHAKEIEHEARVIKSTKKTKVKEKAKPKTSKLTKKTSI
jgi:hypothetical protein